MEKNDVYKITVTQFFYSWKVTATQEYNVKLNRGIYRYMIMNGIGHIVDVGFDGQKGKINQQTAEKIYNNFEIKEGI